MKQYKGKNIDISYWRWFFGGTTYTRPGITAYYNIWTLFFIFTSSLLGYYIEITAETAIFMIIPFTGIFIAIAFFGCGNIMSLLNTDEIIELSRYHEVGIEAYAYQVQSILLCILITVVAWGLYGLGIGNNRIGTFFLFFISSIAIRDFWHLVLFVQMLTIARVKICLRNKE